METSGDVEGNREMGLNADANVPVWSEELRGLARKSKIPDISEKMKDLLRKIVSYDSTNMDSEELKRECLRVMNTHNREHLEILIRVIIRKGAEEAWLEKIKGVPLTQTGAFWSRLLQELYANCPDCHIDTTKKGLQQNPIRTIVLTVYRDIFVLPPRAVEVMDIIKGVTHKWPCVELGKHGLEEIPTAFNEEEQVKDTLPCFTLGYDLGENCGDKGVFKRAFVVKGPGTVDIRIETKLYKAEDLWMYDHYSIARTTVIYEVLNAFLPESLAMMVACYEVSSHHDDLWFGQLRFLGQVYIDCRHMVHERTLHLCAQSLLLPDRLFQNYPKEFIIESVYAMLSTSGRKLDRPKARRWIDQYMRYLNHYVKLCTEKEQGRMEGLVTDLEIQREGVNFGVGGFTTCNRVDYDFQMC